jgi:hypothetical protein
LFFLTTRLAFYDSQPLLENKTYSHSLSYDIVIVAEDNQLPANDLLGIA